MVDKIGRAYQNKTSMDDFFFLLNDSSSIEEFEGRWSAWIVSNGLGSNKCDEETYKIHSCWCPPYMTPHLFC